MLVGLQFIAAHVAGNSSFLEALKRMPAQAQPGLDRAVPRIREFVQTNAFADYVFLGQGPFYGLACEGQLKVKEMSCSYAQCFHTLEFRHGPKSIVGPETLIAFFLSERGYDAEREVLEEVKSLGGTTLVISNHADDRTRKVADLLVELGLEVDEFARLAASIVPCQLLGLFTGLKKGHNPDRPRHLSRAVILDE
jgi:glucosamine--fructose-6-phosphate aminotransferase (isomerizing)